MKNIVFYLIETLLICLNVLFRHVYHREDNTMKNRITKIITTTLKVTVICSFIYAVVAVVLVAISPNLIPNGEEDDDYDYDEEVYDDTLD